MNSVTEAAAIRPPLAASVVRAMPVTSKATISGITVIFKAFSHKVPTTEAAWMAGSRKPSPSFEAIVPPTSPRTRPASTHQARTPPIDFAAAVSPSTMLCDRPFEAFRQQAYRFAKHGARCRLRVLMRGNNALETGGILTHVESRVGGCRGRPGARDRAGPAKSAAADCHRTRGALLHASRADAGFPHHRRAAGFGQSGDRAIFQAEPAPAAGDGRRSHHSRWNNGGRPGCPRRQVAGHGQGR